MTTDQAAEPLIITAPPPEDTTDKVIPFRLDGDEKVLTAVRPKTAVIVRVLSGLGDLEANPLRGALALEGLLDKVVDEESAAYLRGRFLDPDDDLDLDVLGPILETMVGRWYAGPTGRPSGSGQSQKRTGRSSTARRRGPAST